MIRRPRIAYVWDSDYPWDIRTGKTCIALTEGNFEVHLVARNKSWRPPIENRPEAVVHRMHPWRWLGRRLDTALSFPAFFSPRWWSLTYRTVRAVGAEAIVVRDLPLCPIAIEVGRRLGVPVILDMAEHYPAMLRELWVSGRRKPWDVIVRNPAAAATVERWCVKRADRIWVVAEEAADRLVRMGVQPDRIDLVLNTPILSPDLAIAAPANCPDHNRLTVVYLGLLQLERGVMELVDAAALLRERGVSVLVRVIGHGRDAELFHARARELNLTNAEIEFLGYLENAKALQLVAQADIGINPLHRGELHDTCLPNKLFDYMAAGLPVITSDTLPSARVVHDTGAGEVFAAGAATELADAIERLLPAAVRARHAEAARRAVAQRYNWSVDAGVLRDSVRRAMDSRSR